MTKLTTKRRKKLPASIFGLPEQRKYPIDTRARAANAKARATQQVEKGNLTSSEKAKIDKKADKKLYGESEIATRSNKKRSVKGQKSQSESSAIDRYVKNY